MPRTKTTRNFQGTIIERFIVLQGKKTKVFEVRKRVPRKDQNGNFVLDARGRRTYRDKTQRCYSKSEAQIALANLSGRIQREDANPPPQISDCNFFALIEYFSNEYLRPAVIVDGQQISGYRQNIRNIRTYLEEFGEFFGDRPVSAITYEDCRRYAVHIATSHSRRSGKQLSPATTNRKLAYLRRLLNVAKQLRWITVNPFLEGRPLIKTKAEKPRERILTFAEESALLKACSSDDVTTYTRPAGVFSRRINGRLVTYQVSEQTVTNVQPNGRRHLRLLVILAIDTGMRAKEIFTLERRDIDLDGKLINLRAENTKALKPRIIPISDRLAVELREYLGGHVFEQSDLIFLGRRGCGTAFATACRRAGISDLRFHDLRHTAVSWLDQAGVSHAAKQNLIGHASDRVHQTYHNPSEDILNAIRAKINAFNRRREREVTR